MAGSRCRKINVGSIRRKKIIIFLITISLLFISGGYSALNSELGLLGTLYVNHYVNDIRIADISLTGSVSGESEKNIGAFSKDTTRINATIPANSSLTYEVEITNKGSSDYVVESIGNTTYNNSNVGVTSTLKVGDEIPINTNKKFTITLKNNTSSEQQITLVNQYKFKACIIESTVSISTGKYSIGSSKEKIPVVIANNNNFEITGNITFDGKVLLSNFKIPAKSSYNMLHVPISDAIYNSLVEGQENKLSIDITSPAKRSYTGKVIFIKETLPISIVNVVSNINNVSYTQDTINIDNTLSSSLKTVTYAITLRNNISGTLYKFRNITQEISNNASFSYVSSIDLSDGIFISNREDYSFQLTYNYDASKNNSHKDVLRFVFREEEGFGFETEGSISVSTRENGTEENYGDFSATKDRNSSTGEYQYDEEGGLIMSPSNPIGLLNIDQSMGVKDEFSILLTVKGDTNQSGKPSGGFPGTIIAISESAMNYLLWLGFYNNNLHLYSYYSGGSKTDPNAPNEPGFLVYDISKYSNKKMNIIITAKRGGNTRLYINGELITEFQSGEREINYKFSSLGDLREGRGLKFDGVIYEVCLYNKVLTNEQVQNNWNQSNSNWNIK